jgi:hypothetical protein
MHGVGGQAPRTEGRPEYKTEAAEEVIGDKSKKRPTIGNFFFTIWISGQQPKLVDGSSDGDGNKRFRASERSWQEDGRDRADSRRGGGRSSEADPIGQRPIRARSMAGPGEWRPSEADLIGRGRSERAEAGR